MQYDTVLSLFFSPTGTTRQIVRVISQQFHTLPEENREEWDLLRNPDSPPPGLGPATLAIVGMPVYSGRIPALCAEQLAQLQGNNTPAIAVVAYGNRHYDDALLELRNLLTDQGFMVFAAAAVVTQHSIFPKVGKGRPDDSDTQALEEFSHQCAAKLKHIEGTEPPVKVNGDTPYKSPAPVPLKPSASKRCTACGACARLCPTQAIDRDNPRHKNQEACISCAACIVACPAKAQAFRGLPYNLFGLLFARKCKVRREAEFFL